MPHEFHSNEEFGFDGVGSMPGYVTEIAEERFSVVGEVGMNHVHSVSQPLYGHGPYDINSCYHDYYTTETYTYTSTRFPSSNNTYSRVVSISWNDEQHRYILDTNVQGTPHSNHIFGTVQSPTLSKYTSTSGSGSTKNTKTWTRELSGKVSKSGITNEASGRGPDSSKYSTNSPFSDTVVIRTEVDKYPAYDGSYEPVPLRVKRWTDHGEDESYVEDDVSHLIAHGVIERRAVSCLNPGSTTDPGYSTYIEEVVEYVSKPYKFMDGYFSDYSRSINDIAWRKAGLGYYIRKFSQDIDFENVENEYEFRVFFLTAGVLVRYTLEVTDSDGETVETIVKVSDTAEPSSAFLTSLDQGIYSFAEKVEVLQGDDQWEESTDYLTVLQFRSTAFSVVGANWSDQEGNQYRGVAKVRYFSEYENQTERGRNYNSYEALVYLSSDGGVLLPNYFRYFEDEYKYGSVPGLEMGDHSNAQITSTEETPAGTVASDNGLPDYFTGAPVSSFYHLLSVDGDTPPIADISAGVNYSEHLHQTYQMYPYDEYSYFGLAEVFFQAAYAFSIPDRGISVNAEDYLKNTLQLPFE